MFVSVCSYRVSGRDVKHVAHRPEPALYDNCRKPVPVFFFVNAPLLSYFSSTLTVKASDQPVDVQLEIIDLQCDSDL